MDRAFDKVIKSHVVLAVLSVFAVVLMSAGVTYSLFQIDKRNTTNQKVEIGTMSGSITSIAGGIVVKDLYPQKASEITDEDKKYEFTITNDGTYDLKYEVYLKDATDTLLSTTTEYNDYKRISADHYKYINYKLDGDNAVNLASIQEDDKFVILSGTIRPGVSQDHFLQFFLDSQDTTLEGAPNDIAGSVISLDIYFDAIAEETAVETLLSKSNPSSITEYEDGNPKEMYTFSHDNLTTTTTNSDGTITYTHSATQIMDWSSEERKEYRYIGATPNNYVEFNGETWRIIGVFMVETENGDKEHLIKIIRGKSIGDIVWNTVTYSNEWSTSSIQNLLNGMYYNTGEPFDYIYTNNYGYQQTIPLEKGLNGIAREQIAKVKWYLGGSSTLESLGGPDYYNFERGTETCVTTGICNGEIRSTSIVQKVGLIYPSDYIYTYSNGVDNTCYTDGLNCNSGQPKLGWMYNIFGDSLQWTISPYASHSYYEFYVNARQRGYMKTFSVISQLDVSPTLYLKSEIKITDGDGSQENPYTLDL